MNKKKSYLGFFIDLEDKCEGLWEQFDADFDNLFRNVDVLSSLQEDDSVVDLLIHSSHANMLKQSSYDVVYDRLTNLSAEGLSQIQPSKRLKLFQCMMKSKKMVEE